VDCPIPYSRDKEIKEQPMMMGCQRPQAALINQLNSGLARVKRPENLLFMS
jgi:hypothetical protein